MRRWTGPLRLVVLVCALTFGGAAAADASPLLIGSFSWAEAPDTSLTFEVSTTTGLDPWPADLSLDDLFVNFTRDGGLAGTAYFAGDGSCNGATISLIAGDTVQSPGDYVGDCGLFGPLPQDIVSGTLSFTYNSLLGLVSVGSLGPAFAGADPTFESTGIYFEPAVAPVPEPATLVLLGSGLAGVMLRRRARR